MKNTTAQQLINANAAGGPLNYVVKSRYYRDTAMNTSQPYTYRQACAVAKSIREACGYATVERISK